MSGYRRQWTERNLWDRAGGWSVWGEGDEHPAPDPQHGAPCLLALSRGPGGARQGPAASWWPGLVSPGPQGLLLSPRPQHLGLAPHLDGSASTEKGPLMWTEFRLFSNMP